MLDRQKLMAQLGHVDLELFEGFERELSLANKTWSMVAFDPALADRLRSKKWGLLVPFWQGAIGQSWPVSARSHPYQVLAVDASQIYYDRHQGPACFLLNVGAVHFSYQPEVSSVRFFTQPSVMTFGQDQSRSDVVAVNAHRELLELDFALKKSQEILVENQDQPFACLLDGSLLFAQNDLTVSDQKSSFAQYVKIFEKFMEHKILHAGYISFSCSKDLINVVRLAMADFDEKKIVESESLAALTDQHIGQLFLAAGHRSTVFENKHMMSYVYPALLKPYFCYLNAGTEIVRLEFPAWIAHDQEKLEQLCAVLLDQVHKGAGYPVCLFEAHEQAVIKAPDREFFYHCLQKFCAKHATTYTVSAKSLKKMKIAV
jgi:hypothetical protein